MRRAPGHPPYIHPCPIGAHTQGENEGEDGVGKGEDESEGEVGKRTRLLQYVFPKKKRTKKAQIGKKPSFLA